MVPELHYRPPTPRVGVPRGGRVVAAAVLRSASVMLERVAQALAGTAVHAPTASEPVLEFYAEAGAPEGALFVDGEFVGTLAGVTRL